MPKLIRAQPGSRRKRVSREVYMGDLMKMEDREIKQEKTENDPQKIEEYRKKISDKTYLEHAIHKIATDLSHYLTKR